MLGVMMTLRIWLETKAVKHEHQGEVSAPPGPHEGRSSAFRQVVVGVQLLLIAPPPLARARPIGRSKSGWRGKACCSDEGHPPAMSLSGLVPGRLTNRLALRTRPPRRNDRYDAPILRASSRQRLMAFRYSDHTLTNKSA